MTSGADAEVAHEQVAERPGNGLTAAGVVDLLGHGLDGVEPGDVEGQPGHEHERERPVADGPEADAGDHAEADQADDAADGPTQDAAQPAVPHREAARRVLAHPRPAAGQLHGQLAAQDEDRAQVLERGGELQLADQPGPALGALEREAPEPGDSDGDGGDGHGGRDERQGLELQRPEWDGPHQPGRRGVDGVGGIGHRPDQEGAPEEVGDADRQPPAAGDERRAPGQPEGDQGEARPAGDPGNGLLGQPMAGQLTADGAHDQGHEGGEAELLERGLAEGQPPVDRRLEDVAGVGRLDGQRPAAGPRPQPDEDGERHAHPEHVRGVLQDQRRPVRPELLAPDPAGEEDDGEDGEDAGHVDLVERVDPVDVGHPTPPAGRPQLCERLGRGTTFEALWHGRSGYGPGTAT